MNINKLIGLSYNIDPVTLLEFKNYLEDNLVNMCCKKDSTAKIISNSKDKSLFCEHCGCILYKNGKTKNKIQKYICSGVSANYFVAYCTITKIFKQDNTNQQRTLHVLNQHHC